MATIGDNFPQTREARKQKLREIKESSEVVGTVKVPGLGIQSVYRIPLQYLSYNPYNTRFLAQAKTLERRLGRELDDTNPEDVKMIEQFIWEEKEDKNNSTIDSLIKDGQLTPGVVTIEGIILSGNRRFRLLNEISRNHDKYSNRQIQLNGLEVFEAAILDVELSKKDIVRYESFYQYGTEDKADYNPIQKYIAAYTQRELGFTDKEIAENFMTMTDGQASKVKAWIDIFDLMLEYLQYIGEEGIYTALEGKEEAFIRLYNDYKSLKNGRTGNALWAYNDTDLADLKMRFFDFIRSGFGTHDVRDLKKVFQMEDYWKRINTEVETNLVNIKSLQEYRDDNPDLEEQQISKIRDNDFRAENSNALGKTYSKIKATLTDKEIENTPINITEQIIAKIEKLEKIIEGFDDYAENFVENIKEIQRRIGRIKQDID